MAARRVFVSLLSLTLLFCLALFQLTELFPRDYRAEVSAAATDHGIPEELIYAVIWAESRFNENATSPVGACGLMQIMPDTYEWLRQKRDLPQEDLYSAAVNIDYGSYYLSMLMEGNSLWIALASYNAGPNRVEGWIADGIGRGDIPYTETATYVDRVELVSKVYKILYLL